MNGGVGKGSLIANFYLPTSLPDCKPSYVFFSSLFLFTFILEMIYRLGTVVLFPGVDTGARAS